MLLIINRNYFRVTCIRDFIFSSDRSYFRISVDLAKKVGTVRSLRPVLESLFHRILLCPAPQNRLDALKAIREVSKFFLV